MKDGRDTPPTDKGPGTLKGAATIPAGVRPPAGSQTVGTDEDEGLAPGTRLGKYEIVRRLGGGGMGAVYEAIHTAMSKPVALKTLAARVAAEPRAQARFLREAEAASRLDHPHVVDATDFGTDEGISYLVMELLRGEDLGALFE